MESLNELTCGNLCRQTPALVGPSGVRARPLALGRNEGVGPSGVRPLHLAAGRTVGGHYFRYFSIFLFFLLGVPLFKTPEGVVVGFRNFFLLSLIQIL